MLLALRSLWEADTDAVVVVEEESSGGALQNWELLHRYLREPERPIRGDAVLAPARARASAGHIIAIGGSSAVLSVRRDDIRVVHSHAGKMRARGKKIALMQNARAKTRVALLPARGGAAIRLAPAISRASASDIHAKGARNFTNEELITLLLAA